MSVNVDYIKNRVDPMISDLWEHFEAFIGASQHGRAIVLMDIDEKRIGSIYLPPSMTETPHKKTTYERVLRGTVIDAKMIGYPEVVCGARVLVRPWAGLHIRWDDPSLACAKLIPEGREIRFYKEQPHDSIVAIIEDE